MTTTTTMNKKMNARRRWNNDQQEEARTTTHNDTKNGFRVSRSRGSGCQKENDLETSEFWNFEEGTNKTNREPEISEFWEHKAQRSKHRISGLRGSGVPKSNNEVTLRDFGIPEFRSVNMENNVDFGVLGVQNSEVRQRKRNKTHFGIPGIRSAEVWKKRKQDKDKAK